MKTLLLSLLALPLLLSQPAEAKRASMDLISGLEELEVSPSLLSYNAGLLTLSPARRTLKLTIHKNTCLGKAKEGEIQPPSCDILNQTEFLYEITSVGNSCGSVVYEGRQIGGGFPQSDSTIVVQDHRSRVCRDLRRHQTEIYQTITGRGLELKNYFGGSALAPTYER